MRRIVMAAEGASWESALIAAFGRGRQAIEVTRRCVDLVDLLAVAGAGLADAALVDVQLRRLDSSAVERLTAQGVAVVAMVPPGGTIDADMLFSLGIEFAVPTDADASVVASVIESAVSDLQSGSSCDRGLADPSLASTWLSGPSSSDSGVAEGSGGWPDRGGTEDGIKDGIDDGIDHGFAASNATLRRGSVVAVWGPTGAPGRSTTAVTLADEIARLGKSVMLVDADVYGGVVASLLGLLDESPGLAAACRQAQSRRLDRVALSQLALQVNPQLRVLTGIARADRWTELRVGAVETVLAVARTLVDFVVVDLGFNLETDEELSFDTAAPRRNGATLAILDDADLVLAVGAADPIGVQRLVRGLMDLADAGVKASTWVLMNKVRKSAVAGDAANELDGALERFSGVRPRMHLPYDLLALDLAVMQGRAVAEVAPASPFRRAVVELAATVVGVDVPMRGRRRR